MAPRLAYFFQETVSGLRRNGLVAFAAVSTAFISLFLLGGALLVGRWVGLLVDATTQKVEVAVYLTDDVSPAQRDRLQRKLVSMPEVASVEYESKQQAYQRFQEIFANQKDLVQNVRPDALPASFRVKLENPEEFEVVAARLEGEPGIEQIVDQRDVLKRLFAVTRVFRVGVGAVAIVMLVAAAGLIANTVRMALFARRKEIGIMKLVGATNWFIRVPFLIEGVMEGLLGAGTAILALFMMKVLFIDPLRNQVGFLPLLQTSDLIFTVPILLVIGVAVAALASLVAMRRFLEV